MSAGSGSVTNFLLVDGMREADLRTALEIQKANARAWQAIATARAQTIGQLQLCLERYRKRNSN